MLDRCVLSDVVNTGSGVQRQRQHCGSALFDQQLRTIRACLIGEAARCSRVQPFHRTGTVGTKVVVQGASGVHRIGIIGTSWPTSYATRQSVIVQLHRRIGTDGWHIVLDLHQEAACQ